VNESRSTKYHRARRRAGLAALVLARPQLLGRETLSALGRLIPAMAPRFAVAPEPEANAR